MAQSDWDFEDANWAIDTAQYVSSPSSLKQVAGDFASILSRRSDCQNLPQGRIVTQFRATTDGSILALLCRNQAALGVADSLNCYELYRTLNGASGYCSMIRFEAGETAWSASFGTLPALSANTWYQFRFTWWIDWGSVRFRLERWNGSAWVQEGEDVTDPANKWAASSVNRPGLKHLYDNIWRDDTELWGPS